MVRQQLDLDAPLLSVRRRSSAKLPSPPGRLNKINDQKPLSCHQKSLPSPKSDWELTDVTKPGAVPFLWEQSPGRPKPGSESPIEPSNTPRLPPGRARGNPKFLSGEVHQDRNLPRSKFLSGDQNLRLHKNAAPPIGDISALLESLNREVYGEEGYDSEKDEEYTDALETLSTYSMNCSTSGLSGKSSTYFSSDRQTREFVMSRFLPAAKAVAANTPLKKQSSASPMRSRPVSKEMIVPVRKPLFERQKSGSVGSHGHSSQNNESEDEDDDEYDNSGKVSMKTRGFFSRFCLKSSLCLINPVPMMKVRTQAPAAPVKGVNGLPRTAHSGPLTQMVDKQSSEATVYKQKLRSGARSKEFHTVKTKPSTLESPRLSYSGDLRMARGPSPNWSFNRGEISPRQKESSRSPYRRGVAKDHVENNNSVIRPQHFPVVTRHKPLSVSGPIIPITEKILYMDSVKNAERSPNFSSRRMNDGGVAAEPFKQDLKASKSPISQADRMENLRLDLTRLRDNARNGRSNSEQRASKEDDNAPPSFGFSFSVQPPPLPSSPSESWLWRTLPSIPLRDPKKQKHREAPDTGGAKWETIVKTSNVHFDHVRYSEELVPRVPQH